MSLSGRLRCATSGRRVECKSRGKPVTGNSRCSSDRPPVPDTEIKSGCLTRRGRHRSISALSRQTRRRRTQTSPSRLLTDLDRHRDVDNFAARRRQLTIARRINFRDTRR